MDSEGRPLPQPGDEDDDDKVAPPAAGSSPPPARSVDENMRDLVKMKKRDLDQWCFSEHLEPAVFLQVRTVTFANCLKQVFGVAVRRE